MTRVINKALLPTPARAPLQARYNAELVTTQFGVWDACTIRQQEEADMPVNPLDTPAHDDPALERLRVYAVENGARSIRAGTKLAAGDFQVERFWDEWDRNAQRSAREYLLCAPDRGEALAADIHALIAFKDGESA